MKNAHTHQCTEGLPQPVAVVAKGVLGGPMAPAIDRRPSVTRLDNDRLDGLETLAGSGATTRRVSGKKAIACRVGFSPFTRGAGEMSALAAGFGRLDPMACNDRHDSKCFDEPMGERDGEGGKRP